jgi:hypothetical protein
MHICTCFRGRCMCETYACVLPASYHQLVLLVAAPKARHVLGRTPHNVRMIAASFLCLACTVLRRV